MSMEFVMGNSLETLPKTIDFNFEELKGQLAESLALYTGLVVTEDGIKGAKEDRAKLNKLREALENKRKEVKRECMAPYTDFEAKVKELVGLIDQPIAAIDAQLKEYEEKRRADKRAAILEIYEETVGELRALGLELTQLGTPRPVETLYLGDDATAHGPMLATNVYQRGPDGWRLLSRHSSAALDDGSIEGTDERAASRTHTLH